MKKILGATLAIVMGATLVGALAACNTGDDAKDAETAKTAIKSVRAMYLNAKKETPASYKVLGQTKVDGTSYDVAWTVNPAADCTIENFSNYVSVGAMAEDKQVTVSISKSNEMAINYKLNASVTIGKATESVSFDRLVPKSTITTPGETQSAQINLSATATRTSHSTTQQVWEENGVKLTNDKGNSVTDVADVAPIRIYKSSSVTIEYPGILQLVFHSAKTVGTSTYPDYLLKSLQDANLPDATITSDFTTDADDPTVTVTLETPVDILDFTASAGQIRLRSIDVEGVVGGATDAQKVSVAKSTLDLATKKYTATGTYDLPATKNGANISWAVKGTSDNVSVEGGKLKVNMMPSADTGVTLTATITCGEASDTKDITIQLVALGLTNDGTLEHPYTPSEAIKVAKLLDLGATATTEVYVKGYVVAPGTYSSQYGNFDDMYIADTYAPDKDATSPDAIYVYRPKPDGTYLTTEGFTKGDLVTFKGKLQNYKADVQELTAGTCVARETAQRTDAEVVADAKAAVDLIKHHYVTVNEEVTLPATKSGANLSWSVKETTDVVEIAEGKLTIKKLPETETEITIVVTISCGDATDTKEIVISVVAPHPFEVGTYKLALVQANLDNKKLYFDGTLSGNYGATTESPLSAADVEVASVTGGYTFKVGAKYLELAVNGTSAKLVLVDASTAAWAYDYELEVFTWNNIAGKIYYLGTYNTFNTISASETKYISGDNAGAVGVSQFVARFEKFDYASMSNAEKVALVKNSLSLSETTFKQLGTTALPAVNADGVNVSWASNNTELLTVSGGNIEVVKLPETEASVTLTATITCGEATETKDFTVTVKQAQELWRVATSSDIVAGAEIVISSGTFTMGVQNGNYRAKVDGFSTTSEENTVVKIALEDAGDGKFYLKVSDGYLVAVAGKNYLKTSATQSDLGKWSITYSGDAVSISCAVSTSETRYIKYNSTSPRFSCYKSGQQEVVVYVSAVTVEA